MKDSTLPAALRPAPPTPTSPDSRARRAEYQRQYRQKRKLEGGDVTAEGSPPIPDVTGWGPEFTPPAAAPPLPTRKNPSSHSRKNPSLHAPSLMESVSDDTLHRDVNEIKNTSTRESMPRKSARNTRKSLGSRVQPELSEKQYADVFQALHMVAAGASGFTGLYVTDEEALPVGKGLKTCADVYGWDFVERLGPGILLAITVGALEVRVVKRVKDEVPEKRAALAQRRARSAGQPVPEPPPYSPSMPAVGPDDAHSAPGPDDLTAAAAEMAGIPEDLLERLVHGPGSATGPAGGPV